MTPKEKAKELIDKIYGDEVDYMTEEQAKQCALIAVDEMMEVYASACVAMGISKQDAEKQQSKYLQEVKTEIEKL
jgi:nitrogenase subunit NifH